MSHPRGILILDYGSQYTQLIARRIREQHVYSEIVRYDTSVADIRSRAPLGIILSGGPSSVTEPRAPSLPAGLLQLDLPVLGICYGMQLLAQELGGRVESWGSGEYGMADIRVQKPNSLLQNVSEHTRVWMSHRDRVTALPSGWIALAATGNGILAAMTDAEETRLGIQFHPEVSHTVEGETILRNFLFRVVGADATWTPGNFVQDQVEKIRQQVGDKKVLVGVSGGVDSTVTASLLHRAVGKQAIAVMIDHGLLRKNEAGECVSALKDGLGVNIHLYDESRRFLERLQGVTDPEEKRKIIGDQFIRSFERVARSFGTIDFLAQGTLYPDVIESGVNFGRGQAAVIKSHHNVGGLPEDMNLDLVEPLRELFKDEVRNVGRELGLPESLITRHPFPGPGLAVRVLGEITPERLEILREADEIYLRILREEGLYQDIWQAFAVLLPVRTVGVMGDSRTYDCVVALRAVTSTDGMTADWYPFPEHVLQRISNSIVNSVTGVNRVVLDITSKPPGTIEWE
ncbi:MAG: glutamine-hydrolyzing GMP synthase [Candidatus Neomarinimicrobiota bacterium]|nr:MAG: glutamine-hydrolyzing GMP synthase [Candidatus Neomarinimicrobiota bacterium]